MSGKNLKFDFVQDPDTAKARAVVGGISPQIFGEANLHKLMVKITKEQGKDPQETNQTPVIGGLSSLGIPRPVDIITARSLKDISPHHASCIRSKLNAIMGLGFVSEGDEVEEGKGDPNTDTESVQARAASLLTGESFVASKVDEIIDPLTLDGFATDLYRAIEDYLDGGTGYLEVVRDSATSAIISINWIPYEYLRVVEVVDGNRIRYVYRYAPGYSYSTSKNGTQKWFSTFGVENRKWVHENIYKGSVDIDSISEVIAFKAPSNMNKWYGYPDWLSASTIISLLALSLQYKSDFYTNKGVLAYILSIIGGVDGDKWGQIENLVQGSVGQGNNFRNLAIQLPNKEAKVQVDKLASSDKTELQFAKDTEVYAQLIVSAHRVPPVLANILIPGKLGASNETVQALIAFQLLNIGPHQQIIQQILGRTLGGGKGGQGVKGLTPEDFRFRKITSQFDIVGLDTVGSMREDATTAREEDGSPRDVSTGVKD